MNVIHMMYETNVFVSLVVYRRVYHLSFWIHVSSTCNMDTVADEFLDGIVYQCSDLDYLQGYP